MSGYSMTFDILGTSQYAWKDDVIIPLAVISEVKA